jgi:hypothetical protein
MSIKTTNSTSQIKFSFTNDYHCILFVLFPILSDKALSPTAESVMTHHVYSSLTDIHMSLYQTRWNLVTYDGNAQTNTYSTVKYDPSRVCNEIILRTV